VGRMLRWRKTWEIAKKDMASIRRHRYVIYSLLAMPIIFAIVVPFTSIYPMLSVGEVPSTELPPFAPANVPAKQAMILSMVNMALLMFMFIPAAIPSTIATYTFVGEKVNKQLEPLLATPTTDSELLIGKSIGAFLPGIAATFASFIAFVCLVDALTFSTFNLLILPNPLSLVIIFIFSPLIGIMSVEWCVFVSSKVSDVRAAMQLGIVSIAPVLALYFLFLGGILTLSLPALAIFGAILILATIGLFFLSKATFERENILTKWK
jgi:ABC-type Na+ efflux pump permease subunit